MESRSPLLHAPMVLCLKQLCKSSPLSNESREIRFCTDRILYIFPPERYTESDCTQSDSVRFCQFFDQIRKIRKSEKSGKSGNIGLLGKDYRGYYASRDTDALAALLRRAEFEPRFLKSLGTQIRKLQPKFRPVHESTAWRKLLRDLKVI